MNDCYHVRGASSALSSNGDILRFSNHLKDLIPILIPTLERAGFLRSEVARMIRLRTRTVRKTG
jgi:hypothetical protein